LEEALDLSSDRILNELTHSIYTRLNQNACSLKPSDLRRFCSARKKMALGDQISAYELLSKIRVATAYTIHYTYKLYTIHQTLYDVHCTQYTKHYTVCTIRNKLYTKYYTVYTKHYALYSKHYTVCTIHIALNTIQYALYIMH
jgi:hypothetical protein